MINNIYKYIIYCFLILNLFSCTDEIIEPEIPKVEEDGQFEDVYALNFMVTLDNMGSSLATRGAANAGDPASIIKNENYIDPERFRVLFFDEDNMFMFESKNRWIKQVNGDDSFSSWYVSVPLGAFGNDSYGEGKEYDWDQIRTNLTSNKFKIAILANRPAQLLYPGFTESILSLPDGVFKNDGPVWGPGDVGKKSLLDLHHCQYDIIYADKGNHPGGASASYYDFVMGDINTDRPTMGASIHWVNFDDNDKKLLGGSTYMRDNIMPGPSHPIPMYGIQEFDAINPDNWVVGTPYELSNEPKDAFPNNDDYVHRTISLLRSCVRVDLLIPKSVKNGAAPKLVSLWYSNIYSRCEPMDTWTNTKDIWEDDHNYCEWKSIMNYGPISSDVAPGNGTTKLDYQKRLSWFYGSWKEMGWPFATRDGKFNVKTDMPAETSTTPYPKIFNTCIQRNKAIRCESADVSNLYNDGYWHYVVYTGERNMNDPNTLPTLNKNPYIETFVITWDNSNYYCIPLLHYSENNDPDANGIFGPHNDGNMAGGNWPGVMNTYINTLPSERTTNLPYPLLRNHIYRFTLTGTKGTSDVDDLTIKSEVLESPTIDFTEKAKRISVSNQAPKFKVNKASKVLVTK